MQIEMALPVGGFMVSVGMIAAGAVMENRILKQQYRDTRQGPPANLIPWSLVVLNVLGNVGCFICVVYCLFYKWWLAAALVPLYLLVDQIPSYLDRYRRVYDKGGSKKCLRCNRFREYEHFPVQHNGRHDAICRDCGGK